MKLKPLLTLLLILFCFNVYGQNKELRRITYQCKVDTVIVYKDGDMIVLYKHPLFKRRAVDTLYRNTYDVIRFDTIGYMVDRSEEPLEDSVDYIIGTDPHWKCKGSLHYCEFDKWAWQDSTKQPIYFNYQLGDISKPISNYPDIPFKQFSLDTIPVLLLVCDTAERDGSFVIWVDEPDRYNNEVFWKHGYQVLSPVHHYFDNITTKQHVSYLDRNKQLLRKSIVVWMVKPLN